MLHMVHMVHGALRCTQTTVKVINQIFRESYFKVSQHLDTLIFCSPRHKHFKNATCFFIVYSLKEVIGKILINFCVRVCTSQFKVRERGNKSVQGEIMLCGGKDTIESKKCYNLPVGQYLHIYMTKLTCRLVSTYLQTKLTCRLVSTYLQTKLTCRLVYTYLQTKLTCRLVSTYLHD